eukprot:m.203417 g.203417  ORF g.203417 m.203417 type:complete len:342 (-) comp14991_c1_seq1:515-1540(-)
MDPYQDSKMPSAPPMEGEAPPPPAFTPSAPPAFIPNEAPPPFPATSPPPPHTANDPAGESMPLLATDPDELPPAYADDVGCKQGCKRTQHLRSLFFTLGLFTVIILRVLAAFSLLDPQSNRTLQNPGAFAGIFIGVYLVYIIECACSSTRSFVHNRTNDPEQHVTHVTNQKPVIIWHVQCYHYETRVRTRTVSNGNGGTRTETYTERVRVNTHSATALFDAPQWDDVSRPFVPPGHGLTKLTFHKQYVFGSTEAANRYTSSMHRFRSENDRDVHQDFSEKFQIDGFTGYMMGVRRGHELPCSAFPRYFWIFSLLGLSWFFRLHLNAHVGVYSHTYVKRILQ